MAARTAFDDSVTGLSRLATMRVNDDVPLQTTGVFPREEPVPPFSKLEDQ